MKVKVVIKSCSGCNREYKFNPQKYFSKYCNYCHCDKQELKQQKIGLKIKNHMKLKYGGEVVEV